MQSSMKKLSALTLIAILLLSGFACTKKDASTDDFQYIKDKGTLVIGYTVYEPMNYTDASGNFVGFDTEFAEALCAKLGLTPKFVLIQWESKEMELSSRAIDCIWNGLTVSEERRANMSFTDSYLRNEQVVVIRTADAAVYTDAASLAGKTVVAEDGSAGADAVESDLADSTFVPVSAQTDALLEVKAGTADAAVLDITLANAMVGEGTDYSDLMIVKTIDMLDEEYAVGFRVGSSATAKANEVIAELQKDGTLAKLAETYGLTDLLIG